MVTWIIFNILSCLPSLQTVEVIDDGGDVTTQLLTLDSPDHSVEVFGNLGDWIIYAQKEHCFLSFNACSRYIPCASWLHWMFHSQAIMKTMLRPIGKSEWVVCVDCPHLSWPQGTSVMLQSWFGPTTALDYTMLELIITHLQLVIFGLHHFYPLDLSMSDVIKIAEALGPNHWKP
jgi:hypothetical protein